MTNIILNGKPFETSANSLQELIENQNLKEARIVVEYNGAIVRRESWKTVLLQEKDKIELIGFMGGG